MPAQQYRITMVDRLIPGVGIVKFPTMLPVAPGSDAAAPAHSRAPADFGSNAAAIDQLNARSAEDDGGKLVDTGSLLAESYEKVPDDPLATSATEARAIGQQGGKPRDPLRKPKPLAGRATKDGIQGNVVDDRSIFGASIGSDGVHLGGAERFENGSMVGSSIGHDGDRFNVGATAGRTRAVGDDGKVDNGEQVGASITQENKQFSFNATRDGKTTGATLKTGEDGHEIGVSHDMVSLSLSGKEGELGLGGGIQGDHLGVTGSYTSYDGDYTTHGETGDAFLNDTIGASRYASRKSGEKMAVGGSAKAGAFSGGVSVSSSDVSTASFHSANVPEKKRFSMWGQEDALGDRLNGVDDYSDVDLAKLGAGEAYSFQRQQGDGISGEAGVGFVSASMGTSSAHTSRTTLARDAAGDLKVNLATGAGDTDTMGISAAGLLSASETDRSARGESASFTAKGKAGEAAVSRWQETGLLPGVAYVAFDLDDKAARAWMAAKEDWEALRASDSPWERHMAEGAQADMKRLAAPLNRLFLKERSEKGLASGDTAGVTWDEVTTSRQKHNSNEASVLGVGLGAAGTTDSFWESQYREDGEEHKELAFQHDDHYRSGPDDKSKVAVDAKGGVDLAMRTDWDAWRGSRKSLADLGADAFGLPQEFVDAWGSGAMDHGKSTRLSLSLSRDDMARLEDLIGEADADSEAQWGQMAADVTEMRDFMRSRDGQWADIAERERLRAMFTDAVIANRDKGDDEGPFGLMARASADPRETNAVCKRLAEVNTPKEFAALKPAEQRLMVGAAIIAAARRKSNPWEALRLVLSLDPGPDRNALLRDLFVQIEGNRKGSNAPIEFVQFVQQESREIGVDPRSILTSVRVETIDGAKELREKTAAEALPDDPAAATRAWASTLRASVGEPVKAAYDNADANAVDHWRKENRGKRVTDWMQIIVDREGAAGLAAAVGAAVKGNPRFFAMLDRILGDDLVRRRVVQHLLAGTAYADRV